MSTAMHVRKHVWSSRGKMVFRCEIRCYGTSKAIDSALRELVVRGSIVRLAQGVYWDPWAGKPRPSAAEIAEAKIGMFMRRIGRSAIPKTPKRITYINKGAEASVQGINDSQPNVLVYETDGVPSQFWVHPSRDNPGVLVKLVRRAARKIYLDDSVVGRAIKALWNLSEEQVTVQKVIKMTEGFTRKQKREFHSAHQLMPARISKVVHRVGSHTQNGAIQKQSIHSRTYGTFTRLLLVPKVNTLVFQV
jgi:Family of unknown function (DUF6088)